MSGNGYTGGLTGQTFSISYTRLEDSGTELVVATVEDGRVFTMRLGPEETLRNLQAWATVVGLVVIQPL